MGIRRLALLSAMQSHQPSEELGTQPCLGTVEALVHDAESQTWEMAEGQKEGAKVMC